MDRTAPVALVAATCFACGLVQSAPPLFPPSRPVERIDFEGDSLNQLPDGLGPSASGRWAVVDSPTAVSGTQVVVRRGEDPAILEVKEATGAKRIGGEVSLRVLLGPSGAGIACETDGKIRYVLKAEPREKRVALYLRGEDSTKVLVAKPAAIEKGKWARLGILCDGRRIVGYLDGEPVLEADAPAGRTNLVLYADAGVTAQFDDLRYVAQGTPERAD